MNFNHWFCFLWLAIITVTACNHDSDTESGINNFDRVYPELQKYSFIAREYSVESIPFLMGNSEMGGLASKSGNGFPFMWFSDVWKHPAARTSLAGFELRNSSFDTLEPGSYYQELDISSGVLSTRVGFDENSWESQMFISLANPHLMALKIKNTGANDILWEVIIPGNDDGFLVEMKGDLLYGKTDESLYKESFWNIENHRAAPPDSFFTKVTWMLHSELELQKSDNQYFVSIEKGDSAVFYYGVFTSWDTLHFPAAQLEWNVKPENYAVYLNENKDEWQRQYNNTAAILLPQGDYARLFYRSVYTLFATSGSIHFLPGETQFASLWRDIGHIASRSFSNCLWDMNAFTYGAAGWTAMAYTTLGNKEKASSMLNWFYKPESLKANVNNMFPLDSQTVSFRNEPRGTHKYLNNINPEAMTFGHENTTDMENFNWFGDQSHVDWQVHYNAFASSVFHKYSSYYSDESFLEEKTYPLLRGLAEFWSELLNWNDETGHYLLPSLVSLTENLMEVNPIDAALAAKWNLSIAASYARKLGIDEEKAREWEELAQQIYIPQNDSVFLEYYGDDFSRSGGGYQGIRGMVYLSFPVSELLSVLDLEKIKRTLDLTWQRNNAGGVNKEIHSGIQSTKAELNLESLSGMITFIANWFALAEAYVGNGDRAYAISSYSLEKMDPAGNALYETDNLRPYYLDSYGAFALVPPSMLVQSWNDTLRVFPAVPESWEDVAFYDLPAQGGVRVSGEMKDGQPEWINITKNGKTLISAKKETVFCFKYTGNSLIIEPLKSD